MTAPPVAGDVLAREARRGTTAAGPLIVEFAGLPGAGKSTVAHALLSHFGAAGRRAIVTVGARSLSTSGIDLPRARGLTRLARSARFVRFLARRWRLLRAVADYGASVRPLSIERLGFVRSILGYAFQLAEHRRRPTDVMVLDQASLQAVWSVAVRGSRPEPECVRRLCAELRQVAGGQWAVVQFDVRLETTLERVARRPTNTSRFDHMAPDEAMALLPGLQQHLDVIVDAVRAGGVPCVRLDAHLPVEQSCEAIARFVCEIAPSRPASGGPAAASWRSGGGGLDG